MRCLLAICIFCTLILAQPRAASAETDRDFQVWSALFTNTNLSGKPTGASLWFDLHARRSGASALAIVRPGLGWRFSKHLSLWAGYAYVPTDPDVGPLRHEHRPWQQLIAKTEGRGWALQARTRFEQRFRNDGDDTGLRIRQFIRASQKVRRHTPIGFVVWNETFVGLNEPDWGARKGFDQNRAFFGIGARIHSNARIEGGYMSLWVARDGNDLLGHVLATNLFLAL